MIGKISSFLTAVSSLLFEKMSPKSGFLIEHRQFPQLERRIACEYRRISARRFSPPEK